VVEHSRGIPARVEECTFRGGKYRARVVTERGTRLIVETERALAIGAQVGLDIAAVEIIES